ncbi:Sec-independent protein translocase TatB [Streptomyces sp. KMM 9044]|uniref:Sec-independent protein translocase TatB n=1 Tax=Streptomyces sp. KMM 9044 TaxID=2744474 RepID=UPI002150FE27|nr:Sec-independent protein translocase TatB [Streptomyces sp. KMM 9044]WAX82225.1 Sec-independent protein translocase TatB [Streptomyces sp. KMM 9044]
MLALLAVSLFGPDKRPKAVQDVAALIRKVRAFSDGAQRQAREQLGLELEDLGFGDPDPRAFLRKQRADDDLGIKETAEVADTVKGHGSEPPTRSAPPAGGERPAFDVDAP